MYPPHQRTSKSISAVKKRKDRLPPQLTTVLQWQDLHKKKPSRLSCQCHDNRLIRKRPFRKSKTSDFFRQKYGGFASKVRRFYAKKSDVSVLPKDEIRRTHALLLPPQKKFCKNLLHFLHPARKTPIKPGHFGCRIGCRISSVVWDYPTPILHPTPYPTPNPTPENRSKYRRFMVLV